MTCMSSVSPVTSSRYLGLSPTLRTNSKPSSLKSGKASVQAAQYGDG